MNKLFLLPLLLIGFSISANVYALYDGVLPDLGDSDRVSMSSREASLLGLHLIVMLDNSDSLVTDDDTLDYLWHLGVRLTANDSNWRDGALKFCLIKNKDINAFALPGDYICVYNGLIYNAQSEDELASVLAHEIAHITEHHILRTIASYKRSQWVSVSSLLAGGLLSLVNPGAGIMLAQAAQSIATANALAFSRDFEAEADRIGQRNLYNAGFDAAAMPTFFNHLAQINQFNHADDKALEFLQTHPVTATRLSEALERARQYPSRLHGNSISFMLIKEKSRVRQLGAKEALAFYKVAISKKRYNNLNVYYYGMAYAMLLLQNGILGLDYLAKISDNDIIKHPAFYSLKGQLLVMSNNSKQALNVLQDGLSGYPDYKGLWMVLLKLYIHNNNYAKALELLNMLTLKHPEDIDLWRLMAFIYSDARLNDKMRYHYALANACYYQNDYENALRQYELALSNLGKTTADQAYQMATNSINNAGHDNWFGDIIVARISATKEQIRLQQTLN